MLLDNKKHCVFNPNDVNAIRFASINVKHGPIVTGGQGKQIIIATDSRLLTGGGGEGSAAGSLY